MLEDTVTMEDDIPVRLNDEILTVNPGDPDTDSTTLKFNAPGIAEFSDEYKGTLTFTVSVN